MWAIYDAFSSNCAPGNSLRDNPPHGICSPNPYIRAVMNWRFRILALLVVGVLAAVGVWLNVRTPPGSGSENIGGMVVTADVGGPFTLTNQDGDPFGLADLAGQYALIYFGYTYCPDVCPTELGKVAVAIDQLGASGDRVTPVLITVDPERDTAAVLNGYVPLFHERLIGLTGTTEQIREVAKNYRVFYRKVESADFAEYLMDHSSFVYLISPAGEVIAMFGYSTGPDAIADAIRRHMAG